jgi:phosphoribosyl 1,2-cyclic phosphodiesterase
MRIATLSSGSSGNCSLLTTATGQFIIDAGISLKRISASLSVCGVSGEDLSGVLITHAHSDHIGGLPMLMKRLRLPVYAPKSVCELMVQKNKAPAELLTEITAGEAFSLCGVTIRAFATPHDSPGSVGFRFDPGSDSLGYCTDLGYITDDVLNTMHGVSCAVIECNHDVEMLKRGPYPPHLKRRVLSDYGHLSNKLGAELALRLAGSGTRNIILAHLSSENNTPELAMSAVTSRLEGGGHRIGQDLNLYIAPKDTILSCSV